MDLDAYRASAEAFVSDLTAEYYRHFAGLKDDYAIEPIYDRHASLFTRESVHALRELASVPEPGTDEHRRRRMLLDFAVEGHLGQATKAIEAELARREAELAIEVDGERIGFRESAVVQANEPDAARRARIDRARLEATERGLNPLHLEALALQHDGARELGFASYRAMCSELKAIDLERLHAGTSAFADATEQSYGPLLDPQLRRSLGRGVDELHRSDLPRFFRAAEQDAYFPAGALTQSFTDTMHGLGIDVAQQPGVVLDVEARRKKSPRAFCAPVRAPGEVYLVLSPVGGADDFSVLFHEGGHTEHFAHVDPELPFEFRLLGDNAITEAYAFLFQHLVEDPDWLSAQLGVTDPEPICAHAHAQRLVYLRRYTGKLAYELELHADNGIAGMEDRYAALLGHALQIEWPRQSYLADVDPGFYCAAYLRAWALETHLRGYLRERFGARWWTVAEAGDVLRALWRDGQRLTAEELLGELTGEELRFEVLLGDLGLGEARPLGP
jgi:hypothetical protein